MLSSKQARLLPKLTKAELKALRLPRTAEDNVEDAKEAFMFITDMLIGALIEPDRDPEQWCRKVMREALADERLRRIATREIVWKAQRTDNCFKWLRRYHATFMLMAEDVPALGYQCSLVDFNEPVRPNI